MPIRVISKKMGELLIEREVITAKQLELALQQQKEKGGYISQHLISLGFATDFDIANCLSSQYGFPYLPLENYRIPPKILEIVPFKLIKIYSILPIDKISNILTVTMADPLNDGVIEMLKQITSYEVRIFISTYSELSRAIERYFSLQLQKQPDVYSFGEEDQIRQDITQHFIQTKNYSGNERRKYKRIDVDLDIIYFLEGKPYKGKVTNISYHGVYFVCPSFIPVDANVYINIVTKLFMKDTVIYSVVQVVRVEKIKEAQPSDSAEKSSWNYGIAGFFNFITWEDKEKLKLFLDIHSQETKKH